jgi:DNA invertase Pin-like site-specific DNA recombinase
LRDTFQMARYGYARISTRSQRDDSQLDALRAAGCGRIWTDTASGKLARRPSGMPASITSGRATSSRSPACPGWPARSATSPRLPQPGRPRHDLVVLKQGIDTAAPAGRFTFHVLAAMDEMLADLISEATKEGLESAAPAAGGRKPKLTARPAQVARGMYKEKGDEGKRRYTVAEIAGTFGVSRKTIYRHLEPSGGRRQPDKTTRRAVPGGPPGTPPRPARATEPAPVCGPGPGPRTPPWPARLRARTRHQGPGTAATRGPRHRLAAPRR